MAQLFHPGGMTLKAFAVDEFGKPGSVQDMPLPEPAEGEVRVKVAAAAINPMDGAAPKGFAKDYAPHASFPIVPGLDLSGTVDAVGGGEPAFEIGDHVFGVLHRIRFEPASV